MWYGFLLVITSSATKFAFLTLANSNARLPPRMRCTHMAKRGRSRDTVSSEVIYSALALLGIW